MFSSLNLLMKDILVIYSSIWVFYSCLTAVDFFLSMISLLKIIIDEVITNAAPIKVLLDGISCHMKKPNPIANIKAKYFNGVTKDTSENLYDWLSHKFATPPKKPIIDNKIRSIKLGINHPKGIVNIPAIVIAAEKNKEISHTGSVDDNCLMLIAT